MIYLSREISLIEYNGNIYIYTVENQFCTYKLNVSFTPHFYTTYNEKE